MAPRRQAEDEFDADTSVNPLEEPLLPSSENEDANTSLNLFRVLYFLNGLSASTWGRFGIIFYNQVLHLSPLRIGIIQAVFPALGMLSMPLWGWVADVLHRRKAVYLFCKFCSTLSLLSLSLIPHEFGYAIACVIGMSLFRASGVLDAFLLDALGSDVAQYGSIRMYTAVSWGIGALTMGWITDTFGFKANFALFGGMMTVLWLTTAIGLPSRSKTEQLRYDSREQEPAELRTLWKALTQWQVLHWLLQVVVIGSGMALVDSFLFVFLQNDLKASTKLCGLSVGITVLFELPIFAHSRQVLQRIGHDALFCLSMISYIIRAFGYTVLTESSVHWILLLEVLHGITYACMWIASIDFSARAGPPEWSTTVQTVLSACFTCVGSVMGSLIGGFVLDRYGACLLYQGMGWIMVAFLLMHVIVWKGLRKGHDAFLAEMDDTHEEGGFADTEEGMPDTTRREV